ncbi:unnamed protein product, partial [Ectocarpus sp. 6 AP-2014]
MKPVGNGEGEEEEEDGEIQEGEIPTNSKGRAATPGSTAGEALPHQGLQQIEQARSLLEATPGDGGGIDRVKKLLVQSKAAYLRAASAPAAAGGENTDVSAISQGAPQAALICVASEAVFPEAIALVRWFCSKHVASLCEVAQAMEIEAKRLEKQGKSKSKSKSKNRSSKSSSSVAAGSGGQAQDEGSGTGAERAIRLLRVLIGSFNAFLEQSSPGSGMFSTSAHVRVLDIAVSLARKAIERLSRECSADPSVGKAAARLRGLTAAACFAPVSPALDGGGEADENSQTTEQAPAAPNSDNLDRMGKKDVDKLLMCVAGGEAKKDEVYLSLPCICVEAIGALRRVATLAPRTYATIAEAFAAALRCMTRGAVGGPEGEWTRRPALNDANVRHTLFACCCNLAEGLPAAACPPPDDSRLRGRGKLVSALKACHVMRGFVADGHPLPLATAKPGGGSGEAAETAAGVVVGGSGGAGIGSACASSCVATAATSSTTGSASKTAGDCCAGAEAATVEADCAEAAVAAESAADATAAVPVAAAAAAAAAHAAVEGDFEPGHERGAGVVDARSSDGSFSKSAAGSDAAVASLSPATGERTKAPAVQSPAKQSVAGKMRTGKKPRPAEKKLKGAATAVPATSRSEAAAAAAPPPAGPTEGGMRAGGGIAESALPTAGGSHAKKRPRSPPPSPRQEEGGRPEHHGGAKRRAAAAPRGGRLAADLALPPARQQQPPEPRGGVVVVAANAAAAALTSQAGKPTPSASSKSGGPATPAVEEEGPTMAGLFGEEEDNEPESATAAAEADVEAPGAAVLAAAAAALAVEVAAATAAATAAASAAVTDVADGAMPSAAAAPATKSYPPLQTAPEKMPAWREGERYGVVLGDSFYGSGGGGSTHAASSKSGGRRAKGGNRRGLDGDDDTGESNPGQYVHLKYDFVPGRTNLDVPATLRQRPLTENEGRWKGRGSGTGGDVGGGGQQQRWAAEMEYQSRDTSNPEPVRFTGDAVRYNTGGVCGWGTFWGAHPLGRLTAMPAAGAGIAASERPY